MKNWQDSHQPFHWFVHFFEIMDSGGFDVIAGNPPYLSLNQLTSYSVDKFATKSTRNLYPLVLEKCFTLGTSIGRQGFIVPVSSVATKGYLTLQSILNRRSLIASSYDDRPSHLFDGLDKNTLTILLTFRTSDRPRYVTRLNRWNSKERATLFATVDYAVCPKCVIEGCIPKISTAVESSIWNKIFAGSKTIGESTSRIGLNKTYYSRKVNSFLQVLNFVPEVRDGDGNLRPPSEFKTLLFETKPEACAAYCALNSTLFRWFMDVVSDGSHVNKRETYGFPFNPKKAAKAFPQFEKHASELTKTFKKKSETRVMKYKHDTLTVQCIIPKYAKPSIDEIDRLLGEYYGFTEEETEFVVNYDIKYRL